MKKLLIFSNARVTKEKMDQHFEKVISIKTHVNHLIIVQKADMSCH